MAHQKSEYSWDQLMKLVQSCLSLIWTKISSQSQLNFSVIFFDIFYRKLQFIRSRYFVSRHRFSFYLKCQNNLFKFVNSSDAKWMSCYCQHQLYLDGTFAVDLYIWHFISFYVFSFSSHCILLKAYFVITQFYRIIFFVINWKLW